MSEKMKIKDLAQELGINVRDLQKDCSKLNIEISKTNLLEDSDVQKIREYRQAHANDKIEQRETESGVIVRRRKTEPKAEPAKAETKKAAEKPAEVKAEVNTEAKAETKAETKAAEKKTAPKKAEKADKTEKDAETKAEPKASKETEPKTETAKKSKKAPEAENAPADEKPKAPKTAKAKKIIDTPAKIITPAKAEVKAEPAEQAGEPKAESIKAEKTEAKTEAKQEKTKAEPAPEAKAEAKPEKKAEPAVKKEAKEVKKAPLISAAPDTNSAKSILPPVGARKIESPEIKSETSQIRVISRPENTARVVERAERPAYRNDRNERGESRGDRDSRGGDRSRSDRPDRPRGDRNDNRNRGDGRDNRGDRGDRRSNDDRPRGKDGGQRRDNNRFGGMDKDKDAAQAPRQQRQSKPSSSFKINDAFMPQDNEQSRKKRNKNRRTVEFGQSEPSDNFRRRNNNANDYMMDDEETVRYRNRSKKNKNKQQAPQAVTQPMKATKKKVRFEEAIRVAELAHQMSLKSSEIIKILFNLGVMATINSSLDLDTATLVASEFGYEVEKVGFSEENYLVPTEADNPESLLPRPPVVTIMGHVDHGKTSLLDAIRKTSVTSGEAGGITQHIGAYHVKTKRGDIVFLDTPGHEAFTAMRARGAQVTDLVVLVVAADDGVMEQTREAINHSKAAGVPILVAVNKIDKPTANPDRVLQELASLGLQAEAWGGDTVVGYVSAKTRQGLDELLELIALQAEILELKANPNKLARGHVVEAKLDKGRGPVATVLIQEGTLKQGDAFVCGVFAGRVRAFFNDQGKKIKEAGPSIPVEIQGFDGVPEAGEEFICLADEKAARRIAESRAIKQREKELAKQSRVTLETFLASTPNDNETKMLNLVLKADVQGSLEAITDALVKLGTDKVRISVIHSGAGAITETDIMLAAASNAIILGFNVRPTAKVKEVAEREGVDIRFYDIIYKLVEEIKNAMAGLLAPVSKEVYLGQAEIRQTFSVPKVGVIAGCMVTDGKMQRNGGIRILRDGVVVYTGKIASLRRMKDDVKEVAKGFECGIGLENFNDIKVGDVLECFEMIEEAATLD